ncbi:hypothetical protein F7647_09495 [Tenacibaculum piscium]|uniref:hypothetical protein n=1 Tax=Tenacibaculum piscium TaxID=1458515 RepID=UPI00187BB3CF|nr:hypothetical protein [Tenacibaculum piscium]MBE7686289.1 hypothetical protein [Tenacibaculum piscium]MBE7689474.1 hypothetical protein [Tenacibaculum piscium]
MLKKLSNEISSFLYFLNNRKIISERKTRMWFTKQQIYTPALDKVVKGNKTYLSQEIREILMDDFITFEVDVLKYTATDLFDKLSKGFKTTRFKTTRFKIAKSLKDDYNLTSLNGSYQKYFLSLNTLQKTMVNFETKKGRYYEFQKSDFIEIIEMPLIVDKYQ